MFLFELKRSPFSNVPSIVFSLSFSPPKLFPHSRSITSLSMLYRYFPGKFSAESHPLVPRGLTFPYNMRRITHIVASHLYSLRIPLVKCKLHSSRFLPHTAILCNRHPIKSFFTHDNLNMFKYRLNLCLPHICTYNVPVTLYTSTSSCSRMNITE